MPGRHGQQAGVVETMGWGRLRRSTEWVICLAMVGTLKSSDPPDVGPYRKLAPLGRSSSGMVYAARRRERADELAAVKVAHPPFSDTANFRARFSNEIKAIERVKSDFVPRFIDARADDDPAWMATELVTGAPLHKVVRRSDGLPFDGLPEEALWHLGAGLVEALTAIHACGIAHRDLRPKNVLLALNGPWVIGFNRARLVDMAHHEPSPKLRTDYGYMPPEVARYGLEAAGTAADIFGLGATLVFAATGQAPFDATSRVQLLDARPNLHTLAGELGMLVAGCLRGDPRNRTPLVELQRDFARRTGGSGRNGFAAALPRDITVWLEKYRDELAATIGAPGPAELGWVRADSDAAMVDPPAGAVTAGTVPWTRTLGSWISGAVAVGGGSLVVACLNGTVAVLRAADGEAPAGWREPVDVRAALHAGALLVGKGDRSGTAYVGAADGRVHAIDLAPRLDRVVIEAAAAIEGAPVVVGDQVCALSSDGRVHGMDLSTGKRRVLFQMDGAATGTLSVASGTIFATDTASYVYAIDARTGRKNWQLHTDGLVLSAPLPDAVCLYIGGTDGTLREIGIADPSQHRMTEVGAPVHVAPVRGRNLLYVGSSDGVVHAYDIGHRGSAALDEAWHVDLGEEIAGLAASGGRVYVATGYRLMEVDSDKRPPRELLRMDCLIGAPPVISGRHCYVAGLGGVVSCLALN
jgi:outer membrane protein assembly factor BamB